MRCTTCSGQGRVTLCGPRDHDQGEPCSCPKVEKGCWDCDGYGYVCADCRAPSDEDHGRCEACEREYRRDMEADFFHDQAKDDALTDGDWGPNWMETHGEDF